MHGKLDSTALAFLAGCRHHSLAERSIHSREEEDESWKKQPRKEVDKHQYLTTGRQPGKAKNLPVLKFRILLH